MQTDSGCSFPSLLTVFSRSLGASPRPGKNVRSGLGDLPWESVSRADDRHGGGPLTEETTMLRRIRLFAASTAIAITAAAGQNAVAACPWDCDNGDGVVGITDFLALLGQWAGPGPCDFDGGNVGITDFLALLAAWGTDPGGPPDFDGDGDVGITDFLSLLAAWGPCE